jgi:hypothetical protein
MSQAKVPYWSCVPKSTVEAEVRAADARLFVDTLGAGGS